MSTTSSRLAYTSHFDLLDRAVKGNGIRVKCEDHGKACRLRLELYAARKIDRDENKELYEEGDPMFGKSNYDSLRGIVEKKDGAWWLYIQKIDLSQMEIEDLNVEGSGSTNNEGNNEPLPTRR